MFMCAFSRGFFKVLIFFIVTKMFLRGKLPEVSKWYPGRKFRSLASNESPPPLVLDLYAKSPNPEKPLRTLWEQFIQPTLEEKPGTTMLVNYCVLACLGVPWQPLVWPLVLHAYLPGLQPHNIVWCDGSGYLSIYNAGGPTYDSMLVLCSDSELYLQLWEWMLLSLQTGDLHVSSWE